MTARLLCLFLLLAPLARAGDVTYTAERPLVVGVVLFDGFEMLDVFGPLEMFSLLDERARIVTLAARPGPVRPRNGPAVIAERALGDSGPLDLLLVPGGFGTRTAVDDAAFVGSIGKLARATPQLASVCTGAALLARAGLLDGRRATTNKQAFAWVEGQGPRTHWQRSARWVEDGHIATSSGVSAGTDLALALIARHFDRATAERVARDAEYIWNARSDADPFAADAPPPAP